MVELEFDENKIPTQNYLIENSKTLKNKPLYRSAKHEVKISKDLHQTIEFFSVFASAIGTTMYIQSNIPYKNDLTNIVFIVGIVFGFYVGKVIAQGQQKLFSNLLESTGAKTTFGAFVMWAFLISLDVALMGSGTIAVSEMVQEQKYLKYEGAKIEKNRNDALAKIEVIEMEIRELEDEKKEAGAFKGEVISKSSLSKIREEKVDLLKRNLKAYFDKDQTRIYRIWNTAGGTSGYGSEKSEKRASKKRYKAKLKREVEALEKSIRKKHNKIIKDNSKDSTDHRKNIKDITSKMKRLTDDKAKIDLPTLLAPAIEIDKKIYFGIPFFIAIFLSLLDLWKISVSKKFDTYVRKQATEIRNEIISSKGFNHETYSKRGDEEAKLKREIEAENRKDKRDDKQRIERDKKEEIKRTRQEEINQQKMQKKDEQDREKNTIREYEEIIKEDREAIMVIVDYYKDQGQLPSVRILGEIREKSHMSSTRLYKKYSELFIKGDKELPYIPTELFKKIGKTIS